MVKNPPATAGDARNAGLVSGLGWFPWSGEWEPTSVFLPEKFQGQRSLVGYSPWGGKDLDFTEHTHTWRGFQYLQNSSKTLLCVSFDGETGSYPKAALDCFYPIPSLPWLTTAWICPSELRKVMEAEWRLFPIIKDMGDTERSCAQEPHRALHGVISSAAELPSGLALACKMPIMMSLITATGLSSAGHSLGCE